MWIFSVIPYIALVFFSTPNPYFLTGWSIGVFLLTSVLPETTALSTFTDSCSSVWQTPTDHSAQRWWAQQWPTAPERTRAWVVQLGQALPASLELSSRSKYVPDITNCLFLLFSLLLHLMPLLSYINTLQLLSDTKYPGIFLTYNTSSSSF